MTSRPVAADTRLMIGDFLAALFDGADGVVELRAFPSKDRTFAPLTDLDILLQFLALHVQDQDCYVGIAARRDSTSGTLENCTTLGALYTDLDFKMQAEAETRRRLDNFPLPPSLMIRSGGGLHAYWLLREPLDLRDVAQCATARSLLVRLAAALGGDRSAAEPARILRVPGTFNRKYTPPVQVTMETCEPSRRYNPSELEEWLPPAAPGSSNGSGFHTEEKVHEPGRRTYIFRMARSLKAKGLSEAATLAAARVENVARCVPVLPDDWVDQQVKSAFSQADRPGYEPDTSATGAPRVEENGTPAAVAETPPTTGPAPAPEWPTMAPEALYGLAGRIVEAVSPYSEADPVATLAHVLVAVGNAIGPGPHARVQQDAHPCRLNAVLVGETSKGRKGLSWSTPRHLIAQMDPDYARLRIRTGLSSGEGLIYHVRDPRSEQQPVKERGRVVAYQTVVVDEGELDKRLLILEPELAVLLKVMARETNTLSGVIRQAWDSGELSTLTKNTPIRASGAHVSIVGHITREELQLLLTQTDRANGFANRFLWFLVKRAHVLPEGEPVPAERLAPLLRDLETVLGFARSLTELHRDDDARADWADIYPDLSAGLPGLVGAILNRAEAQVLRLSTLYAVMDGSALIRPVHLKAAVAVWEYAEASVKRIFGDQLGLSAPDTILAALRRTGPMDETAISGVFGRHKEAAEIHAALTFLLENGLVRRQTKPTGGRPKVIWEAVTP